MRYFLAPIMLVAAVVSPARAQTCAVAPSGLVGWWTGDGNALDIRGGSNGTLIGGTSFAAAKVGQGFVFIADGDGVALSRPLDLNVQGSGLTVDFWMRGLKNQSQPIYTVIDKSHGVTDSTGWFFEGDSATGKITFGIGAGGTGAGNLPVVASTSDVLDGNFHHVAGIWDGSMIRLYLDGLFQGSALLSTPANNALPVNFGFGWGGGTPNQFFRGILDEVQIYSRALSVGEIGKLFAAGDPGFCRFPYYFSQLAFGGGWQTTLTLINYTPRVVSCATSFFTDSGSPLLLPFAQGTISSRTDILGPGESVHDPTISAQSGAVSQGWAQTSCDGSVQASLLYRLFQQGTAVGEAGVNAMTAPATKFATYADAKAAVAYANPSSTQSALVTLTVINSGGIKLGSASLTLGPLGHGSANLGPLVGLPAFVGFVQITSTIPIVSLSLNAEAFPSFSSLPPGQLADFADLVFP